MIEEVSKKANVQELSQRTRQLEKKNQQFDSELMSIIGSINSRAKLIRNRIRNMPTDENSGLEGSGSTSRKKSSSTSSKKSQRNPLTDISIEYSNDSDQK